MIDKFFLENLNYYQYKGVFDKYRNELEDIWVRENTEWTETEGTINVFVIRCNDIYITNDMKRNNDFLVIIENRPDDSFRRYVFKCTADPKQRRDEIANLMEQIYSGNIRNHRQIPRREAICQDNCDVFVRRYSGGQWYDDLGKFGINIHNPAGFFNSSLGCVILASEDDYLTGFRPLLRRSVKKNIPVAVIRDTKFQELAI